jgi:hypothetical protein
VKDVSQTLGIRGVHERVSDRYFNKEVRNAMYLTAASLTARRDSIINWEDRLQGDFGAWNHCAHFDESFTHIWDGFPLPIQKPTKWDGDAEFVYQGKYKACVYKGHIAIAFWGGIVACSGPEAGVDHDVRIWDDTRAQFPTTCRPGEWGLGDLAYISCERVLTGRKRPIPGSGLPAWSEHDEYMKNLIAHYRARVENVIRRVKSHEWCRQIFRGSFKLFTALFDISVIGMALEIRREFELDRKSMFEVVGPWQHRFY